MGNYQIRSVAKRANAFKNVEPLLASQTHSFAIAINAVDRALMTYRHSSFSKIVYNLCDHSPTVAHNASSLRINYFIIISAAGAAARSVAGGAFLRTALAGWDRRQRVRVLPRAAGVHAAGASQEEAGFTGKASFFRLTGSAAAGALKTYIDSVWASGLFLQALIAEHASPLRGQKVFEITALTHCAVLAVSAVEGTVSTSAVSSGDVLAVLIAEHAPSVEHVISIDAAGTFT